MTPSKREIRIFNKQLQDLLQGDPRVMDVRLIEEGSGEDQINNKLHTQLNKKFIKQKVMALAKLRFKSRKVASVEVEEGKIVINFVPQKEK